MDSAPTIEALRVAARALDCGSDREAVKAFQTAQDALDAAKADRLASLQTSRDFELNGASTLSTWDCRRGSATSCGSALARR